jgi:4-amino-4-deoxy-L-arabinose transferase-like glycosyltransferase
VYGLWIYPQFLKEKIQSTTRLDYTQYLILHGFIEINSPVMDTYKQDINNFSYDMPSRAMSGSPEQWIDLYGPGVEKMINLISYARILDALLLSGAVVLAYLLILEYAGMPIALTFSFFYGFNTLLMTNGLKAHSEGLFIFLFNAAIYCMHAYFVHGKKINMLIIFSILSGLCMATKLNGILVCILFVVLSVMEFGFFQKHQRKYMLSIIPVIASTLVIFVVLNPYTYSDPFTNIKYMYDWRKKVSSQEQAPNSNVRLENFGVRINKILTNYYFSDNVYYFNGVWGIKDNAFIRIYGMGAFIFLLWGIARSFQRIAHHDISTTVFLCTFIIVIEFLGNYLVLDWPRYYIQLPLFITLFQTIGAREVLVNIYRIIKKYI